MAGNDAAAKLFDALNQSSDALIDAVRAASERGHRVSTALIEQAQEGQRETVQLAKKWAEAPLDVAGFYGALIESTTKAQSRTLEALRQWFSELGEAQKETRDIMQRLVNANRTAGEASVDLARGLFSRAGEAVQSATRGDGNGRRDQEPSPEPSRQPRQPSRGAESSGETRSAS